MFVGRLMRTGRLGRAMPLFGERAWMSGTKKAETTKEKEDVQTQEQILYGRTQFNFKSLIHSQDAVRENINQRNLKHASIEKVSELYQQQLPITNQLIAIQTLRNKTADEIKELSYRMKKSTDEAEKKSLKEQVEALIEKGKEQRIEQETVKNQKSEMFQRLMEEALKIPNTTHPSVPIGDESHARIVSFGSNRTLIYPPQTNISTIEPLVTESNQRLKEIEPNSTQGFFFFLLFSFDRFETTDKGDMVIDPKRV